MPAVVTLSIAGIESATPRSRLVTLALSPQRFQFAAGQAVLLGDHGQDVRRPYSIASSPERTAETGRLELLIGLDAQGEAGPHLTLRRGQPVDVEGPVGSFTFPEVLTQRRLLFVAGGSGIAPLRAMLDHAFRRHPAGRISLLYSARNAHEFAFLSELETYANEGRLELHPTVTRDNGGWAGRRGRIGRVHFEAVLHDRYDTLCFICGPEPLVTEAMTTLRALGVPPDAIRTEEWVGRS